MLAIIGGSGLPHLSNLSEVRRAVVSTPYGEPSSALTFGEIRGEKVIFVARHGDGHTTPPHAINYRANIWALHEQGVKDVVAIASVGGIRPDLAPGTLVIPDQIIDYTYDRKSTFALPASGSAMHIDFTYPYCERLRQRLFKAAEVAGERVVGSATYAVTQGPRLETAAEVNRLERDGAHVVGMTAMPEAVLARECGLCYATLAVVVNHAAGRGESADGVRLEYIEAVTKNAMTRVLAILEKLATPDGD